MSRLAYVLMMMWIAGLALGLPAGMVMHGSKAGAKGVGVIDANDSGVASQIAQNGTVAAKDCCCCSDCCDYSCWYRGCS